MLELNLKTKAATQTTKAYNSMCKFGDKYLGATGAGLFEIGGYNDNGSQIAARVDSGQFDSGMNNKKRFRYFYFGLETAGSLKLSVYGDGMLAGEYTVTNKSGMQNVRVPISRSVKARYWQWRIENISGAFFALYSVEALPVVLAAGLGD